jgi:16S rRNA (guanine(966)-N(2))-methyltransferase RsmD
MRVIAGSARGIALEAPRGTDTRPITDKVKESLFGILGDRVLDAAVLDLYAGSGAVGIEALSRGAAACTFVERGRAAVEVLRRNLARTGLDAAATVVSAEVQAYLERTTTGRHRLVMLDPPFAEHAILAPLRALEPLLEPDATVVVRTFWRTPVEAPPGLAITRQRRFGETMLTFLQPVTSPAEGRGGDR